MPAFIFMFNFIFIYLLCCLQAKIPCSGNCKCIGCRNIEDPAVEKKTLKDLAEAVEVRAAQINKAKIQQLAEMAFRVPAASNSGARYVSLNFTYSFFFKAILSALHFLKIFIYF